MSKVMGIYVKFTKTTHQIWSCHVTLAENSENFYFWPNSVLNVRKSFQIWGNWLKNKISYRQKQIGGGKHPHPPVLIGLKFGVIKELHKFFPKLPKEIMRMTSLWSYGVIF